MLGGQECLKPYNRPIELNAAGYCKTQPMQYPVDTLAATAIEHLYTLTLPFNLVN